MLNPHVLPPDYAQRYGPWAVIAGGSEGIGASFARMLAASGIHLVLLARRAGPLETLASAIRADFDVEVRPLAVDLTRRTLVEEIAEATTDLEVGLLVYNAGATIGYDRFVDWKREDLDFMIALNCSAPVHLAHHFGRAMSRQGRGGMIFLTSAAASSGAALMSIYPATKAFDHILAEGLWHDMKPAGVDVLSLVVGATRTPSHAHIDFDALEEKLGVKLAMECDDVAHEGLVQLGRVSTWVVGEQNRKRYPESYPLDRMRLIEEMSRNTALLSGREHVSALDEES